MALMSSESTHYRAFYPELLAVVSLALLMGAVMTQVSSVVKR